MKAFLFKTKNKTWMPQILIFSFSFVLEVLTMAVRKKKKSIKCVKIEIEEVKLSLFANMFVYLEYLKVYANLVVRLD